MFSVRDTLSLNCMWSFARGACCLCEHGCKCLRGQSIRRVISKQETVWDTYEWGLPEKEGRELNRREWNKNYGELKILSESKYRKRSYQRIMNGRKGARNKVPQKMSRQRIPKQKEWPIALTTVDESRRTEAKKPQSWTSGGHWKVETASQGDSF